MITPHSIEEVQKAVQAVSILKTVGGSTKPALSTGGTLSTNNLSGVLEYEPNEYTFTALAGTPLSEIEEILAENKQFLPFDPPWRDAGATIGGTVASGLSGAGRFRYGGVRDFLLGVRLVTGAGRVVFGGGKVVKNAAGFDLPKLMVGGLGRWGVLVELTFKVFPLPEAFQTLKIELASFDEAHKTLIRLLASQFELTCLELDAPRRIWIRLGGLANSLEKRMARLQKFVKADSEILGGAADAETWRCVREFEWVPPGHGLIKMPLVSNQITDVEQWLHEQWLHKNPMAIQRRYSVGGNVAWIAIPETSAVQGTTSLMRELPFPALALRGQWEHPWIGDLTISPLEKRLLPVFDPDRKIAV